jgi:hypothetical protein
MPNLSDTDRQALRLADDLQKAVEQWLSHRGAGHSVTVSPFVDPAGQPAVVIKMNARVAYAMINSLNQQHSRFAAQQPGPGGVPGPVPQP